MLPRLIAWFNTLIPIIAVIGAYQISLYQGVAAACMPLLEGCTSISAAARNGDAIFFFRGLVMPLSMLLIAYWIYQWRWLNQLAGENRRHTLILVLGIISALAMVFYANFLGTEGNVYRFMRRFGIIVYFAFAFLAQLLSLYSLLPIRDRLSLRVRRLLNIQWTLVWSQWVIGLISVVIGFMQPEWKFEADNIIEWNFAWVMVSFYALNGWLWKELPPKPLG
jgi:hypothetical protein